MEHLLFEPTIGGECNLCGMEKLNEKVDFKITH